MRASRWGIGISLFGAALAALIAGGCADPAGPHPLEARFAIAPSFASAAAGIVPIDQARIVLRRSDGTVARDTVVTIPPGTDSVALDLTVQTVGTETFALTLALITPAGDTAFRAGPVAVTPGTSGEPPVIPVEFVYVGVGADAVAVEIVTAVLGLTFGETVLLDGVALGSNQLPIAGTPIGWRSLTPALATVPAPDSGRVVAGTQRGTAQIVAELLTGPADTVSLLIQPVADALLAESGGGQTAIVGTLLPDPLVARVLAADGQGVANLWLHFETMLGGGVLSAESVLTDATGRAQVQWTLGAEIGTQTAIATTADLPGDTALFIAQAELAAATHLAFLVQPSAALVGAIIDPPVEVGALNQFGDVDMLFEGDITVAIGNFGGDGALLGTTTRAAVAGIATFDDLSITGVGPGWTLEATAAGLTPATSNPFDILAESGAQVSWLNAADGNWSDGANWSTGAPPGPLDTARIEVPGTYTVTLDVDASVDFLVLGDGATGQQTLRLETPGTGRRVLSAALGTQIAAGDQLELFGGELQSNVHVEGWLTVRGSSAVTGTMTVGAIAFMRLISDDTFGDATLSVSGFTNNSRIEFLTESSTTGRTTTLDVTSGTLTNDDTMVDPGGGMTPLAVIVGDLVNRALLTVNFQVAVQGTFTHAVGAALNGNGTLDLTAATGTLDGLINPGTSPGVLTILGTVPLGPGAELNIEWGGTGIGQTVDQLAVVGGPATLDGTLNVTLINDFVPVGGERVPIVVGKTGDFATVNLPALGDPTLSVETGSDTLYLVATASSAPPGINEWITTSGTWSTDANWSLGRAPIPDDTVRITTGLDYQVTLDVSPTIASLAIGGTADIISLVGNGGQSLTITDAGEGPALDILALGSLSLTGGTLTVDAMSSQGSVNLADGAMVNAPQIVNAGTWQVFSGTVTVGTGASSYTFEHSGTLVVDAAATLAFAGPGFVSHLSGTVQGGGRITLGAGTQLTLAGSDLSLDGITLEMEDAQIARQGGTERLTVASTSSLQMRGVSTGSSIDAYVINQGFFLVQGAPNVVTDSLVNEVGSLVTVLGEPDAVLSLGNGLLSNGVVNLDNAIAGGSATLELTQGWLTVGAQGGLLSSPGMGGGTRTLRSRLVNQGGVSVGHSLTIEATSAAHVNDGSVFIDNGTTLAFAGSGSFTSSSVAAIVGAGTGTSTLDVSTVAFTNDGQLYPGSPGILNVTGDVTFGATAVTFVVVTGLTPGSEHDQLNVSGTAALSGTLSLVPGVVPGAGAVFDVLNFGSRSGDFTEVAGRDLIFSFGVGMALDTAWATAAAMDVVARGQILFHASQFAPNPGIYRSNADAKLTMNITPEFSITDQGQPRWSPDYKWLTYGGQESEGPNLMHVTTADGFSVFHVVTEVDTRRSRFSPDAVHLAFECGSTYEDVCTIPDIRSPADGMGDGGGRINVTQLVNQRGGPGVFAWNPRNPDQLAVVRDEVTVETGAPASGIYTVSFDGTNAQLIAILPDNTHVRGTIDWSPDGQLLAFGATDGQGVTRLYTLTLGGTLTAITDGRLGSDENPVFSPEGGEILFVRGLDECAANYWAIRPDGASERQLTGDDLCDFDPAWLDHDWSPDGSLIVLMGATSGISPDVVFVVPRDVTPATYFDVRRLLRDTGGSLPGDIQPSWRP